MSSVKYDAKIELNSELFLQNDVKNLGTQSIIRDGQKPEAKVYFMP